MDQQNTNLSDIVIWDSFSGRVLWKLNEKESSGLYKTVDSISFSHDDKFFSCAGKTKNAKTLITIWMISVDLMRTTCNVQMFAKQLCDTSIVRLKFMPLGFNDFSSDKVNSYGLVSVGACSIRFWRIKNKCLAGHSVVLKEHSNKIFTDLCFDLPVGTAGDTSNKRILVSSNAGEVYEISNDDRSLHCIYQLHQKRINCICMNHAFVITGSDDCLLRLWSADLDKVLMEMKCESPITNMSLSCDGLDLCVATQRNIVGVVNIDSFEYKNLLRAHYDSICSINCHPTSNNIVSV